MAHRPDESDRHDDLEDWENPSSSDIARGQGHSVDLAECPYCRKFCAAIAEVCPHCHSFLHFGNARRYPWWIWVGLVAAIAAAAMWVIPF